MALLDILTYPDPFLKTIAHPITSFDEELDTLIEDMIETMYDSRGIGLASTQIGSDKQIFIMDIEFHPDDPETTKNPIIVINPKISDTSGEIDYEEGCLSVPDIRAIVRRPSHVKLSYQTPDQSHKVLEADGLMAVCIQHEFDHLNGKLFIDRLPKMNRKMLINKLKKQLA